jgi:hypothetical protein
MIDSYRLSELPIGVPPFRRSESWLNSYHGNENWGQDQYDGD